MPTWQWIRTSAVMPTQTMDQVICFHRKKTLFVSFFLPSQTTKLSESLSRVVISISFLFQLICGKKTMQTMIFGSRRSFHAINGWKQLASEAGVNKWTSIRLPCNSMNVRPVFVIMSKFSTVTEIFQKTGRSQRPWESSFVCLQTRSTQPRDFALELVMESGPDPKKLRGLFRIS